MIEIRNRFNGEIVFIVDGDTLSEGHFPDADLQFADLRGADLRDADLIETDLRDADLSGADLRYANLWDADLRRVDLTDAKLPPVPVVENLDAKILAAIEAGNGFEMEDWHTCDTTHCRYGWAIHLAGEAGRALTQEVGPKTAGALIYWKSAGYIPSYRGENDEVLEDIRRHAAAANA